MRSVIRHSAPVAASSQKVAHMSDVTIGPCARIVGEMTKSPSENHPAAGPQSRRDQRKTSRPVATLQNAIAARAVKSR